MQEIMDLLKSPAFWFSAVFVNIFVNLVCHYFTKMNATRLYDLVFAAYILFLFIFVSFSLIFTNAALRSMVSAGMPTDFLKYYSFAVLIIAPAVLAYFCERLFLIDKSIYRASLAFSLVFVHSLFAYLVYCIEERLTFDIVSMVYVNVPVVVILFGFINFVILRFIVRLMSFMSKLFYRGGLA